MEISHCCLLEEISIVVVLKTRLGFKTTFKGIGLARDLKTFLLSPVSVLERVDSGFFIRRGQGSANTAMTGKLRIS